MKLPSPTTIIYYLIYQYTIRTKVILDQLINDVGETGLQVRLDRLLRLLGL